MLCPCQTGEGTESILAYLGKRLGPEEAGVFATHLAACEECRELLAEQQAVFEALDNWLPEPISPAFDQRLRERIEIEEASSGWWRNLLRPVMPLSLNPAMVAAAACLILVAGVLMRPTTEFRPEAVVLTEAPTAEQIERAVEDLEMLLLLDPVPTDPAVDETPESEKGTAHDDAGVVAVSFGARRCV